MPSLSFVLLAAALAGCGGGPGNASPVSSSGSTGSGPSSGSSSSGSGASGASSPVTGASDFESAPAPGLGGGGTGARGGASFGGAGSVSGTANASAPTASTQTSNASSTPARAVQETDLYKFDAATNRLYYLNGYRGLMVFDLTVVDKPKLLGRYAIFGTPVQMLVQGTLAVVVVADWYGTASGAPFHGSIVEGLDATDPSAIKVVGQAPLGGWVRDTRVVGNVLYAVSEDYGWQYGWGGYYGGVGVGGVSTPYSGPDVIVSSVSFGGGLIQPVSSKTYKGYNGVFNVTPNSIMLAHPTAAASPTLTAPAQTDLEYLDISDPGGKIVGRGKITVDGSVTGWGADNGRWNLDFADGKTAHVLGVGALSSSYVLATVDYSNPDAPVLASELSIAGQGWTPTTRFDSGRMYLAPTGYTPAGGTTPLEIYDLSNPAKPALANTLHLPGSVWIMIPSGQQLFALGQDSNTSSTLVSLKYVDVTNAAAPVYLGSSEFGEGWSSTPATDTFKAFTHDPAQGLVVLPFSGWDWPTQKYNNGVQLINFDTTSIATAGAALTKGWTQRGIFANGRIISLSDLSLGVVDYTNRLAPKLTAELTLARNVIASQPAGATIAEISSDWWGNDASYSEVRALPIADASEQSDESAAPDAIVPGVDARAFTNGTLSYVVTSVQVPIACGTPGPVQWRASPTNGQPQVCYVWQEQVQVVDVSGGGAKKRGVVALPVDPGGWYWNWGWFGFLYDDWYSGGDIVQVGSNVLAFRRWHPNYGPQGQYVPASTDLFVVDLSNPDAPSVASTVITDDWYGWWGDMRVVGNTLYTTHYEWPYGYGPSQHVKYYLDQIDLSDPKNPKVGAKINVPGILVGGTSDGTTLYTIDYRWDAQENDFDVLRLDHGKAYLQSRTVLDGWVGNVYFAADGKTAYTSTQLYSYVSGRPNMELHQLDLSNPAKPVDNIASGPNGWGWLLGVNGDRMLVQSGWGDGNGLDVYKLTPGSAPAYDQFVRTQGWSISSIARSTTPTRDQLFLSSGDWGVQVVNLK